MFALSLTLTLSLVGAEAPEPAAPEPAGPRSCAGVPTVAAQSAIGAGGASLVGALVMVASWNGSHDVAMLDVLAPAVIVLGGVGGGIAELDGNGYFLSGALGGLTGGFLGASVGVIATLVADVAYVILTRSSLTASQAQDTLINGFAVGAVIGAALGAELGTATVDE